MPDTSTPLNMLMERLDNFYRFATTRYRLMLTL